MPGVEVPDFNEDDFKRQCRDGFLQLFADAVAGKKSAYARQQAREGVLQASEEGDSCPLEAHNRRQVRIYHPDRPLGSTEKIQAFGAVYDQIKVESDPQKEFEQAQKRKQLPAISTIPRPDDSADVTAWVDWFQVAYPFADYSRRYLTKAFAPLLKKQDQMSPSEAPAVARDVPELSDIELLQFYVSVSQKIVGVASDQRLSFILFFSKDAEVDQIFDRITSALIVNLSAQNPSFRHAAARYAQQQQQPPVNLIVDALNTLPQEEKTDLLLKSASLYKKLHAAYHRVFSVKPLTNESANQLLQNGEIYAYFQKQDAVRNALAKPVSFWSLPRVVLRSILIKVFGEERLSDEAYYVDEPLQRSNLATK